MLKIKRNDEVIVIAGRDKGRRGEVTSVLKDGRVLVAGVNMVKKHQKGNPTDPQGRPGGIIDQEAPLQVSNVAIFNRETGKADRVGFRFEEDEDGNRRKVRYFKSNDAVID